MSGSAAPTPPPAGQPPSPSGSPQPGQPPIGSSPATGPSQNLGQAAKGLQAVGVLLNGMAMIIPMVGPATPIGQAIAKALTDIGKHVPPGASSPQGEKNAMQQMMMRQQQMAPHKAAMGAMGSAPPPPPGGGDMPPPGM